MSIELKSSSDSLEIEKAYVSRDRALALHFPTRAVTGFPVTFARVSLVDVFGSGTQLCVAWNHGVLRIQRIQRQRFESDIETTVGSS